MIRKMLGLGIVALLISGCALDLAQYLALPNAIETFPSRYSSDADFLNLASDDRALREQARRNVFIYYNCLTNGAAGSLGRQDPVVFSRSQNIAFSEIPGRIYQSRLDRLANMAKDYNNAAVQNILDAEMIDLRKIPWHEIQLEVNAIVTGRRKTELATLKCPLTKSHVDFRCQESRTVSLERFSCRRICRVASYPCNFICGAESCNDPNSLDIDGKRPLGRSVANVYHHFANRVIRQKNP